MAGVPTNRTEPGAAGSAASAPANATLVLAALILVAAVANLNLSVANVALPSIGAAFDSSQKESFLNGDQWAYTAGIVAIVIGAALVFVCFPKKAEEERLLAQFHAEDSALATSGAAADHGTKPPLDSDGGRSGEASNIARETAAELTTEPP